MWQQDGEFHQFLALALAPIFALLTYPLSLLGVREASSALPEELPTDWWFAFWGSPEVALAFQIIGGIGSFLAFFYFPLKYKFWPFVDDLRRTTWTGFIGSPPPEGEGHAPKAMIRIRMKQPVESRRMGGTKILFREESEDWRQEAINKENWEEAIAPCTRDELLRAKDPGTLLFRREHLSTALYDWLIFSAALKRRDYLFATKVRKRPKIDAWGRMTRKVAKITGAFLTFLIGLPIVWNIFYGPLQWWKEGYWGWGIFLSLLIATSCGIFTGRIWIPHIYKARDKANPEYWPTEGENSKKYIPWVIWPTVVTKHKELYLRAKLSKPGKREELDTDKFLPEKYQKKLRELKSKLRDTDKERELKQKLLEEKDRELLALQHEISLIEESVQRTEEQITQESDIDKIKALKRSAKARKKDIKTNRKVEAELDGEVGRLQEDIDKLGSRGDEILDDADTVRAEARELKPADRLKVERLREDAGRELNEEKQLRESIREAKDRAHDARDEVKDRLLDEVAEMEKKATGLRSSAQKKQEEAADIEDPERKLLGRRPEDEEYDELNANEWLKALKQRKEGRLIIDPSVVLQDDQGFPLIRDAWHRTAMDAMVDPYNSQRMIDQLADMHALAHSYKDRLERQVERDLADKVAMHEDYIDKIWDISSAIDAVFSKYSDRPKDMWGGEIEDEEPSVPVSELKSDIEQIKKTLEEFRGSPIPVPKSGRKWFSRGKKEEGNSEEGSGT